MPNPTQSELSADSLPANPLVEAPTGRPANRKDGLSSVGKRALIALVRFLIIFCIGVSATLTWQSYGDAARETIASSYPQLRWLVPQVENADDVFGLASRTASSPDQQQPSAISLDLDALRYDIDRIATSIASSQEQMMSSADQVATSQEQMMRSLDRIATGQEQTTRRLDQFTADQTQMTREITKLQEIGQSNSSRNSEPSSPPVSASAPKPVSRPSSASAPKPVPRPASAPAAKRLSPVSQEPTVP
jgi:hypothetical protein